MRHAARRPPGPRKMLCKNGGRRSTVESNGGGPFSGVEGSGTFGSSIRSFQPAPGHGKTLTFLMSEFFTRERFGGPQFLAGLLLLVFLGQCLWLASRDPHGAADFGELARVQEGLGQWHSERIAGTPYAMSLRKQPSPNADHVSYVENNRGYDAYHSPLYYLIPSAHLLLWSGSLQLGTQPYWGWLARAPYLVFGILLGASLWYVSRRLYGNAGGYIALTLYCFSPGIIRASALWSAEPEVGAAWGAFGAIFTAIAVAHTLYAPREVVLWNWRRIGLLGVSIAITVGSQFSMIVVVPLALAFLLYLAPIRRSAALAIWAAACFVAFLLLFASCFFRANEFWRGIEYASFSGLSWKAFTIPPAYHQMLAQLGQSSPALVLALPIALIAYFSWHQARYFGNTATLLVAVLFLVLALGTPHFPGLGFQLMAVPFLFVFVAGIAADLLETRYRQLAQAAIWGLLVASAAWNVWELA